jgi:glutathione S-transferase
MLRLRLTMNSPFARKVRVVAHELGIADRLELVPTETRVTDPAFWSENPLGKVPVLVTDDGQAYADSPVICEYLDATYGGHRLLPAQGAARWRALTLAALADGVVEAAILVRRESQRPEAERAGVLIAQEQAKVERGLDRLQQELARDALAAPGRFDLAAISAACALGYLEYRFGTDAIFGTRADLRRWWQEVALPRPSMQSTMPA